MVDTDLFPDRSFGGLLFDMDGTLLTSIEASERVWTRWAAGFGLDAADFLTRSHGMRVPEVIEQLRLPGVDPARHADWIMREELADMEGVCEVPGAADFLTALPAACWAVVTSAPRVLAVRRLEIAGLPVPPVLVTADDIVRGKPDPSGYQLAAERLRLRSDVCLVFEDAPAGVQAGEAAGAEVLLIAGAHRQLFETRHRSVQDYRQLMVVQTGGSPCGLSVRERVANRLE